MATHRLVRTLQVCSAVLTIALLGTASALAAPPADWPTGRLPLDVVPQRYDLDLTIIPDAERFSGRVTIDVNVLQPVSGFWLHGKALEVTRAEVTPAGGASMAAEYTEVSNEDGVAWLELPDALPTGPATLVFEYSRPFDDGLSGLYKVTVGEDDYAFTQLESVYARKVFPGFDEPAFKTPFTVAVTTRADYAALANSREVRRTELPDGLVRVEYARTPPLPTYLIAFAVGPLDVVEHAPVPPNEVRSEPLPLRGIAARGQGDRLAYALANTAPMVADLERYFASPYPYDKLDIVAVPDFAAGAMENAGLITYREGLLLIDEPAPIEQIKWFGMVHAHELSHMWLGNLVTMPWWDDIWLNESFATWLQARIAGNWRPDLRVETFGQGAALRAMQSDSLTSVRQIREPVNNLDDIISAFDSISYQKGGAVLQMFETYLGKERFQEAMQQHMARYAFGSAAVDELIDSLERVAPDGAELRGPMYSFLFQPGVPSISVDARCSDASLELDLAQERYLPIGSAGDRDQSWQLPVCMAFAADTGPRQEHCVLLTEPEQSFSVPVDACPSWVMPNSNGSGYFRFALAEGRRRLDTDALAEVFLTELTAGERLMFIDSLTAGVAAGTVPPAAVLDSLATFAAAPEPGAVSALAGAYTRMLDDWIEPESLEAAREYGRAAFAPRLAGLDAETTLTRPERANLRRSLTSVLALVVRDAELRTELRDQVYDYLGYREADDDLEPLDPDLRQVATRVAVQESDTDFVQFLIDDVRASEDALRRGNAVRAMAHASSAEALELGREFALSGEIRGNEFQAWGGELLNRTSGEANWAWLQANLVTFMDAGPGRAQRDSPLWFANGLCTLDDAERLQDMYEGLPDDYSLSPRKLAQAVESVELCAAAREELTPAVTRYFK